MKAEIDQEWRAKLGDNWIMRLQPGNDEERALFAGLLAGTGGEPLKLYCNIRVEQGYDTSAGPGGILVMNVYVLEVSNV